MYELINGVNPIPLFVAVGLATLIAGGIGWWLKELIQPKHLARSPSDVGRKWMAWMVLIVCVTNLTPFIGRLDKNSFALWVLAIIVFGAGSFAMGWAYGKFFVFKKQTGIQRASNAMEGVQQLRTESDDDALFTQVAKEIVREEIDEGLWAKAFALENGDERKTKAHYMRLRVEQLQRRALSNADSNASTTTGSLSGRQNFSYKVPSHLANNPRSPNKLTCPACDFYGHMIAGEKPTRMRIVNGVLSGVAVYVGLMLPVMLISSIPEAASLGPILVLGVMGYAIYFGYTKAKQRFDYLYCPKCGHVAPVAATVR